jgi:hypothetical protein
MTTTIITTVPSRDLQAPILLGEAVLDQVAGGKTIINRDENGNVTSVVRISSNGDWTVTTATGMVYKSSGGGLT